MIHAVIVYDKKLDVHIHLLDVKEFLLNCKSSTIRINDYRFDLKMKSEDLQQMHDDIMELASKCFHGTTGKIAFSLKDYDFTFYMYSRASA